MIEKILAKGRLSARIIGENGDIKGDYDLGDNLIVNNGKYAIADQLLASPTLTKPTHMGIGTGVTAPAVGDAALGTEIGTRGSLTKSRNTNVVTLVATFAAGNGTGAVTEAGIFTASTAGTMYSRITFAAINKGANDTLELTWTYTIG